MTNIKIMLKVNIHEAKANLSRYLEAARAGEKVLICNRNVPVAELRALPEPNREPRPVGLGRGTIEVPASFFDPLPDEVIKGFEG